MFIKLLTKTGPVVELDAAVDEQAGKAAWKAPGEPSSDSIASSHAIMPAAGPLPFFR